jgi:hypothetical protein
MFVCSVLQQEIEEVAIAAQMKFYKKIPNKDD